MGVENGRTCSYPKPEGEEDDTDFCIGTFGQSGEKTKFYLGSQAHDLVDTKFSDEGEERIREDSKFCIDDHERDEEGSTFYVYYITCCATMGGLLFGYDTGIISGSMLLLEVNFQLSTIWKELIVSATVGAAAVFALIAGNLTDWLGRKKVVMFASVLFTAGAVVMAMAPGKEILLVGRMVSGTGLGG